MFSSLYVYKIMFLFKFFITPKLLLIAHSFIHPLICMCTGACWCFVYGGRLARAVKDGVAGSNPKSHLIWV